MTTSHLLRRVLMTALAVALAVGVPVTAQKVSEGDLLLRDALHKQQVEGDLPGAIKIYQQIVSMRNGNRAVVARALLEMAGCYEKLGRQAENVYQQIVREFGDQPVAAQARARLAVLRPVAPSTTMTLRRIEVGEGVQNIVAGDGGHAVYWDSTRTKLYFGDLSGKQKRLVLETTEAPLTFPSRDLSMVFLAFPATTQGSPRFGIVKTDGTGYRPLTMIEDGKSVRPAALGPVCAAWSWDNRDLVICNAEGNTGRLLKVSVADGKTVDLMPGQTVEGNRAEFSPDGRHVAYNRRFPLGFGIVPVGGGQGHVVPAGAFVDWSRDGRHLLVAEETGNNSMALSAVPFTEGSPSKERISLRSVPAAPQQVRTLLNGSLLIPAARQNRRAVYLGTLDAGNSSIDWNELSLVGNPVQFVNPSWSPDSRKFVYNSREGASNAAIRVRDITNNDDREVYRNGRVGGCAWLRQRPELVCTQASGATSTEIIAVSIDGGRAERLSVLDGNLIPDHLRADDKTLVAVNPQKMVFAEFEIGSDRPSYTPHFSSQDGRWNLSIYVDGEHRGHWKIRPMGGSESDWRPLAARRLSPGGSGAIAFRFSPDGDWLVYHDRDENGKDGLYRVSTSGGTPERLGDYPSNALSTVLSISPDGRKFLVNAPPPPNQPELWVLENFLPTAPAATANAVKKTGK